MSYYETAYPSLLSGVSQQNPQLRLPGQLTQQVNMLSDLVRGLVRRPPLEFLTRMILNPSTSITPYSIRYSWRLVNIAGDDLLLVVDRSTGELFLRNPTTGDGLVLSPAGDTAAYLSNLGTDAEIKTTSVGAEAFLVDVSQTPTVQPDPSVAGYPDPARLGYTYVVAGDFNTGYSVTVRVRSAIGPYQQATGTYSTPDGATAGDPAITTPEHIASELETSLNAALVAEGLDSDITVYRDGAYLFFVNTVSDIEVLSDNRVQLLQVSGVSVIRSAAELPARLPGEAADYIVQVGRGDSSTYFRYDATAVQWVEDAAYGQADYIGNLGIVLAKVSPGVYSASAFRTDRRASGTSETNPTLKIAEGVTGLTAFKGRLVLLAGQYVCMSAANNPRVWYRTTLTGLVDSDPIEVAAATELSAPYHSAVAFNTGLLVTSTKYQALIPGDVVLSPRTASIAIVSNYDTTDSTSLTGVARSAVIPFNRRGTSNGETGTYTGLLEAVPTDSFTSSLVATDTTAHIPTYMLGKARCIAASSSNDAVVMLVAPDELVSWGSDVGVRWQTNSIFVHQFLWEGSEKRASAWHRWDFKHPVLAAYFIQNDLYIVFGNQRGSSYTFLGVMALGRGSEAPHHLDYGFRRTANSSGQLAIGPLYKAFVELQSGDISAFKIAGDGTGLGEIPAVDIDAGLLTPVAAEENAQYVIGYRYASYFEPTPPILRDRSDHVLADAKIPVIRYKAHVVDSGVLTAQVSDRVYDSGVFEVPIIGLDAPNELGTAPLSMTGVVTIPARTSARDTSLVLSTDDFYGFNVVNLEYGFKLNMKHRRG